MEHIYDCIIIGGGPAGLSAGLYAARSKMDTLLIEKAEYGGQVTTTAEIENYPGSIENCTGSSLSERMKNQASSFGVKFMEDDIADTDIDGAIKVLKGKRDSYRSRTIIIATGANPRLSGFKNEEQLRGRGISYCATCDADFFTGLDVAVIGGGNSAITEAIYLSKFAENVIVIHRRDSLRATKYLQDRAFHNSKIKFIWNSVVEEAKGKEALEQLVVKNKITGETRKLKVDGCFVFVGYDPVSQLFREIIKMDEKGYIITDEEMRTNIEGVFAAGDVRKKSLRQIVTAAADGAIAATTAESYIEKMKF
ncbi:thioredoxin-disulfide reductase [Clostridium luticellarii]|uniref:Thioredoxin reductase n=1 Tax=Clostridium luticellarii TaxID=1691940 RepID=A0A2T0BN68_9CLOT|nr:thioredoxin-disulfide reductase [Clostridium luticellarii]MCI1945655.1 thioredoxin-disulfide reductase [Clostridium luticellarii]MCI1967411.1 thioredoxin-disulfide reductase [Clostridium luticellarii]MCI1996289.1 thioredoxin-disulfide reductase [Clostridium luticellarii]MCI2039806.1 thioredoxin-disulfide reductase [Clostridium luticellarii]PRR85325.1 Thioredoxin reductase [Clostridium luticellarii]